MENHTVRKEILIDAPPETVWRALTDPEITKKYFYNCKVLSTWEVGGPITFKGKMFWVFPIKLTGTIRKIEPGKLLQYTLQNHGSSGKSLVTDELINENGRTRLKITDDVGTEKGFGKRYKKSIKGWDKILDGLKRTVEKTHQ